VLLILANRPANSVVFYSLMCKLMEVLIKDQIVQFLINKGLLSKSQHAFIKNHSTATNLLESLHDWSIGLNSHLNTDIVYIDFSKAFDSIVLSKLLFKLELYGISGHLLKWIGSFLSNRLQCVVIDHFYSPIRSVISGVPQGSVLGPILFIIYVNDIDSVCCGDTSLQLFADDAKLYSKVVVNNISVSLQLSLDRLTQWAKDWQLHININKCSVLPVTHTSRSPVRQYFINGVAIPCQNSYVDLGVTVTSNLSFELHINNIVSKARQRISTLFRGFLTRNLYIMRQSFTTYIRPLLEYNSIVWNPSFIYLIDVIENVQRNFSKRIQSISSLSYLERLAVLDLEPLELRRLRFDLIYYFKVLNHLTPFDPKDIFTIYMPAASLRSNSPYLQKPTKASNKLLHTLFYRNVDAWNALPVALRSVSSLFMFKSGLRNVDLSRYLKGSVFN
jgi:ribonuclease P/MRP protein subunit RPP40